MKTKSFSTLSFVAMITLFSSVVTSCKSNGSDADIKTAIEKKLEDGNAMIDNSMVDVKDGVVTLTGECMNDSCKKSYEEMIKNVSGVKSVIDNFIINMNMKMNSNMPMMNSTNPMKKN